jgi:hypothetical protein
LIRLWQAFKLKNLKHSSLIEERLGVQRRARRSLIRQLAGSRKVSVFPTGVSERGFPVVAELIPCWRDLRSLLWSNWFPVPSRREFHLAGLVNR